MIVTDRAVTRRPVTDADGELLVRLFAESRPDLDLLPPQVRGTVLDQQVQAQLSQYAAEHPTARHDIVCVGGTDVGRLILATSDAEVRLVDLVIAVPHRRRGIAAQIMADLTAAADRLGLPMTLSVWPTNYAALDLYTRHGFEIVPSDGIHVAMRREAPQQEDVHE
jgi:ribosomal protein S18 acetylase RimI-like enzyme